MKKQPVKFQVGEVVTNVRNGWKRKIKKIDHKEKNGILKVVYFYTEEIRGEQLEHTGEFDPFRIGLISQDSLNAWIKGRD